MFRFLRYFGGAVIAAVVLAIPFMISSAGTSSPNVSIIVEFRDDPAAVYSAKLKQSGGAPSTDQVQTYRNTLSAAQDKFLSALQSRGINFSLQTIPIRDASGNVAGNVTARYTLVYNGMTLTVPEAAVPTIASMAGVKKVHANGVMHPDLWKSVPYIGATKLYGPNANNMTPFANPPDGNEGQGVYVAVIDTGIDWTHPMFGGDKTPPRLGISDTTAPSNQKVVYQLPLADIITDGFGHGTHVASTIAGYYAVAPGADGIAGTGNGTVDGVTGLGADDIPLHGVAPQAKLMSYKVCSDVLSTEGGVGGPVGGCLTSSIVLAIEDSVAPTTLTGFPKPIANVISMSLGGGGGPDEPTSVASDNATLPTPWNPTGTSVVAAAGNSGDEGEGTLGAPAAGRRVIGVGASNDPGTGANTIDITDGSATGILAFALGGSAAVKSDITNNYVFCGLGETPADFPATVRGRIALIQRGSTVDTDRDVFSQSPVAPPVAPPGAGTGLFLNKIANATAAGAVAVVIFNNAGGEITAVTAYKTAIPALGISKDNGKVLMDAGFDGTGVSNKQIRINKALFFAPAMASFSSQGPVEGFGQVKPDVSAPGVNILAAAPPASALAALAAGENGANYIAISGTSMATPHTSGAVALLRTAHMDWTPDILRTALINSATNLRSEAGAPQSNAYPINTQGGGLIDVYHASNIKALMGEVGDGVSAPSILGSHSYGEVPVVNNRVTSTQSVTVTIKDMSGQGGTYNIAVADNQDVQINGINVSTSTSSVSVPAGGSATFTVNTTFDGNLIRDPNVAVATVNGSQVVFTTRPIETQWYITASRADGGESLRMPFYYKPVFSQPAIGTIDTQTYPGTVTVGSTNLELQNGADYVDVPFTVTAGTFKLDATLDFMQVVNGTFADLDLFLLDSNGNVVTSSTNPGGPEHLSTTDIHPGNYVYRVDGFLAANTNFTITSRQARGSNAVAPTAANFAGDFVDAQANQVDFDGNVSVSWTGHGGELGYEVEQSDSDKDENGNAIPNDQKTWNTLGGVDGGANGFNVNGLADGKHFFRVRAIFPGQIGKYVTGPSNVVAVLVSQRSKVDITSQTGIPLTNMTCCTGGVWSADLSLTNNSGTTYMPYVDFNVIRVTSSSGTVRVKNAENGKSGIDPSNPAAFSFTSLIGSDQLFTPSEITGAKSLQFYNNGELFSWDVLVTAYVGTGAGSSSSGASSTQSGSSGGTGVTGILPLTQIKSVMRFTYNPLTKTVTKQLVSLK